MSRRSRYTGVTIATVSALLLAGSAMAQPAADIPSDEPSITTPIGSSEAVVHFFQWPWESIGRECTDTLGPAGFGAVEVSAPQEHVVLPEQGYPWWQDYQPVSYQLDSRRGDRDAFADMVAACDAAGVEVYIDAVINHMTGLGSRSTGSGGNTFDHYEYPAVPYGYNDFHHCGRHGDDDIRDWADRWEVQNCELLNLADLATENDYVRGRLTAYLQDLLNLGVDGFRIDAAKHMPAEDIAAILAGLDGSPKVFLEVIEGGPGEISPTEYTGLGRVTEFRYGYEVGARFADGNLGALQNLESHLLLESADAMTFIDNHDTQRNGQAPLTYRDGARYRMAQAFNLAHAYGAPHLLTGFTFDDHDQGPPADSTGMTLSAVDEAGNCLSGWDCVHRERTVLNMVAFRSAVGDAPMTDWWGDGSQIGFGRGDRGYAAFNATDGELSREFTTGLPPGVYCDVANGDYLNGRCTGPTYEVDDSGTLTATVPPNGVLAVHVGAKI
ncbi:alpha-amylase [Stackebrandtia endophytica]|uniref:Alpha-amylase n=1 Tax=Stackebrandtia endophytica TaxID=1496996 RepID=A0A543AQ93_9ACTN|nr:alpha-amylase family protein [Stackebrandtia endophytica]TQL74729.1 alpha-amylase [Stackebrandtia endophytica]